MDEELMNTLLTVAVPTVAAVSAVVVLVMVVFWVGAGRQTTYEDAVKARQGHAERELRKMAEREREQKQKKEKKRPGKGKRHEAGARLDGDAGEAATPQQLPMPAQKSILKTSNTLPKADSSSVSRVDFDIAETPTKPSKTPRTNPPTPHPSAQRLALPLARSLEPDVEEEDDADEADEGGIPLASKIEPQKQSQNSEDQPRSKPRAATSQSHSAGTTGSGKGATVARSGVTTTVPTKSTTASGGAASRGQKKSKKAKLQDIGEIEALPASRISDIVSASSLTDDEIQHLIDLLLEMMDANAEWKGGSSKGTESVKSLKKANEDLMKRCADAEKTVQGHFSKIKELRGEIKAEQSRRQVSEGQLQARINKQGGEITIFKTKISGLEEELKQTRQLSTAQTLKQLEEENATLNHQMSTLMQENTSLTTQLAARNKSLQEAQEQTSRLNSDLRRAKAAAKSPVGGAEGRGSMERVTELEVRLHQVEEDNASLQAALTSVGKEKEQLVEQVQGLAGASQEADSLSQQLSTAKQQLQEAQVAVQAMEEKGAEGEAELRRVTEQLSSQLESLQQQTVGQSTELRQARERCEALQQQAMESASTAAVEMQRLRETNARLGTQVEQLQTESAAPTEQSQGPSQEEVEEMKLQLRAAHEEEQRALVAKMEVERSSEVTGLKAQYEAELHGLKEELARVQREGEEIRRSVEQQLSSETCRKQELQSELETLKSAASLSFFQQNGPLHDQVDGELEEDLRAKEEELSKVKQERDELRETLKTVESKLSELQSKNSALRENCWKARDDSARLQKESEAKLSQVYRDTEGRVKAAEARVAEEKEEGERALLQRLFPDVRVAEVASFSIWVDHFEAEAQQSLDTTLKKVRDLTERVEELEETEQTYIQEAQGFRETLNLTLGSLGKLQEQVTNESIQHQQLLEERDEMLQSERGTNRDLQQQLSKERATVANLEEEIKKAVGEERVRELESQLEEATEARDGLHQEVDRLTTSLDQATQLRSQLERKLRETEESLQSAVELEKIGQSIVIPGGSTEV